MKATVFIHFHPYHPDYQWSQHVLHSQFAGDDKVRDENKMPANTSSASCDGHSGMRTVFLQKKFLLQITFSANVVFWVAALKKNQLPNSCQFQPG